MTDDKKVAKFISKALETLKEGNFEKFKSKISNKKKWDDAFSLGEQRHIANEIA